MAAIVDSADDAIISKDLDGNITSWNRGAQLIFGYTADEIIGRSVKELLPLDRHTEEDEILGKLRRGEKVDHFETFRRRKNGEVFPVSLTVSPIWDSHGVIVGASKIARDISAQVQAARAVGHLGAIVDSSDDAIVSKDLNGIVRSWNRGAERIFGYSPEEMIGQPITKLFPPDRLDEETRILERLRRGDSVEHFETKRVRKDGVIIDISVTISPICDHRGIVIGASKIARDITRQKAAQAELVRANEELRRADQLKSEFLATLSHELRTPLNAILGWTHVLKLSGVSDPAEWQQGLEVIERNARAQAQMIQDLLDVSRIVSGKVTLDIQELHLEQVVEAAVVSLQPSAQAKNVRLTSAFSSVDGVVRGDRERLQQVIWNLLSNALKFTPKGGRVHVTIERRNSHVEVAVSDNGQGISREFLPHVFERFRQADGSTTRRHGGLGLGLSIVKQLVELHGGDVRAYSEGEGKGATFIITLPVTASRATPAKPSSEALIAELTDRLLEGVRVLAVDDDPDSGALVRRLLAARGAEVRTAESAAEGIRVLDTFRPDIILSDIGMPDEDGYAFISQIRARPNLVSLPAVALTALARSEDRTRALRAGFQTHVAKPVEPAELVAVVRSLVSLSGVRSKS